MLELAIGIMLAGIIMSAAFSLYLAQHKHLLVQNDISDLQSALRTVSAELATNIRQAGYRLPEGIPAIEAFNSDPDTIALAFVSRELDGVQTEQPMSSPSSPLLCDGHDLSSLGINDWIFIIDPTLNTGEYVLVSEIDNANGVIQHSTMSLSRAYPAGCALVKIKHFKYYIDSSDSTHPDLICQINFGTPEVFAENITDLQFRYVLSSLAEVDVPAIDRMVREVVIRITARSESPDQDFQGQFRYRSLTTRVKVRNLSYN